MPKIKLDHAFCLTASCQPGKRKTDYWDLVTTGFVLECRSTGGKTYYLRYFDPGGRQRQHKIGSHADITFDQARKAALRLRSEVVLGGDPAGTKDMKKSIPLYRELAAQHIAHAKTFQKCPGNTEAVLRCHVTKRWGKFRLDEIKTQDIARWLGEKHEEGLAPATVEKIRVVFSRSFELGRQWDVPGAEINPVRNVPRRRFSNIRERFLSTAETERLFTALRESDNQQLELIVALLLLTGARKSELLNAEWGHVDLERRSLNFPTTKSGKPRRVPLSQAAVDVIERLPKFENCPYLVPNPKTKKPFVTLKHSWETARRTASVGDVCMHDLRRTFASNLVNSGVDLYAVGKLLGHSTPAITAQRYAHLANDTLLAAVEAGAAKMKLQV